MSAASMLARHARLAVAVGLSPQPGQRAGGCMVEHAPLARRRGGRGLRGGRAVRRRLLRVDQVAWRAHIEHADAAALGWSPPWLVKLLDDPSAA